MTNLNHIHPKYTLTTTSKANRPHSNIHASIQGTKATIIDVEIGKRGWLAYLDEESFYNEDCWSRIHTTTILNITVDDNGNVCIETENTFYNLTKIKEA